MWNGRQHVFSRCINIVWMVFRFMMQWYLFHIRHLAWNHTTNDKRDALLHKQAKVYREKAVKLGGVLIKVGQFLSTRTDFMPAVFTRELRELVDKVTPVPFAYSKEIMETEWEGGIDRYLTSIETTPVASASIGQVYKAVLKDGTPVAVKVQRYRVDDIFHIDFKALKMVFLLIKRLTSFGKKMDLDALYRELVFVMERELDFRQELAFAQYFKDRFQTNKYIYIPEYYPSLCTQKILVMEWVEGQKVTDPLYRAEHQIDRKQVAQHLFDFYFDQFFHVGYFHGDPHLGNMLLMPNGCIAIIDFGMMGEIKAHDIQYFKHLIQGFILNDYDRILGTLDEMNFLLPHADREKLKQMLKQTFDQYKNSPSQFVDGAMMEQLKQDIQLIIHDQPIQIAANYVYLGRAIAIMMGLLVEVYPRIDIPAWSKRKVKDLYDGIGLTGLYKEIAKDAVKPIFKFPKAVTDWLQDGEKNRKWEKHKQQRQMMHHFYMMLEVLCFVTFAGCFLANGLGLYQENIVITMGVMAGCGISLLLVIIIFIKHHRFIRKNK